MTGKKNTKNKLDSNSKAIIINMLAAYYSNKEIVDYFKEELGLKITSANVSFYRKHKKKEIQIARVEFHKTVECLPVAQKVYRIQLRQKLIDDLLKNDRLWSIEKTKYGHRYKSNHLVINKILDSVREEMEPKKLAVADSTGKKDVADKLKEIIKNAEKLAIKYQRGT